MISGNDSETKSNSVVSIPAIVFVAIGLFAIIIGIALVAFFGGFYVMDEWDSKDWTETEVLAIGQDYTADEGTQIFFYNYSVDGVEYNSTFSCDYFIGSGAQSADESSTLAPWKTQCLHDSEYYLNLVSDQGQRILGSGSLGPNLVSDVHLIFCFKIVLATLIWVKLGVDRG